MCEIDGLRATHLRVKGLRSAWLSSNETACRSYLQRRRGLRSARLQQEFDRGHLPAALTAAGPCGARSLPRQPSAAPSIRRESVCWKSELRRIAAAAIASRRGTSVTAKFSNAHNVMPRSQARKFSADISFLEAADIGFSMESSQASVA